MSYRLLSIINFMKKYFFLFVSINCASLLFSTGLTDTLTRPTKRVEVYAISQFYWDVAAGETLGGIVKQLLPDNPGLRKQLLQEIVQLNPQAFSLNNPDNLQANIRLWLPNHAHGHSYIKQSLINKPHYNVKSFSWGQLYKPKR